MSLPALSSAAWNDTVLDELRAETKIVINPRTRERTILKQRRLNYELTGQNSRRYLLYFRQSVIIPDGFSCGLLVELYDGTKLTLARYNGADHEHTNHLEGTRFAFVCHQHKATARYILAGRDPDGFAEPTDAYRTVDGALRLLIHDCTIRGLNLEPPEPSDDRQLPLI